METNWHTFTNMSDYITDLSNLQYPSTETLVFFVKNAKNNGKKQEKHQQNTSISAESRPLRVILTVSLKINRPFPRTDTTSPLFRGLETLSQSFPLIKTRPLAISSDASPLPTLRNSLTMQSSRSLAILIFTRFSLYSSPSGGLSTASA